MAAFGATAMGRDAPRCVALLGALAAVEQCSARLRSGGSLRSAVVLLGVDAGSVPRCVAALGAIPSGATVLRRDLIVRRSRVRQRLRLDSTRGRGRARKPRGSRSEMSLVRGSLGLGSHRARRSPVLDRLMMLVLVCAASRSRRAVCRDRWLTAGLVEARLQKLSYRSRPFLGDVAIVLGGGSIATRLAGRPRRRVASSRVLAATIA